MHGSDVVQDDLVCWAHVFGAMKIIGAVQESSSMVPQMCGRPVGGPVGIVVQALGLQCPRVPQAECPLYVSGA